MSQSESRFYIPGLDGLRAIAVLGVFIAHLELIKSEKGLPSLEHTFSFFSNTGGRIGVILFFVLSGFLITTLLMREHKQSGTVRLRNFYLKRVLRIWPIYYLLLAICAVLGLVPISANTWTLCLLIFPNVANAIGQSLLCSPHIWSIGAEEQFYLVWPVMIKKLRNHLLTCLLLILVVFTLAPFVISGFGADSISWKAPVLKLFYLTKFNCFAIGGIAAWWVWQQPYIARQNAGWLAHLVLVVVLLMWIMGIHAGRITDECYAFLFALLIAIMGLHKNSVPLLENKVISYLGRISYGIYMYHWLAILLAVELCKSVVDSGHFGWVSGVVSLGITVGVSALSFHFFEGYFLSLKKGIDKLKTA